MQRSERDDSPIVSVGVPVYNGERYLERCLNSIQNQTVEHLEIVVADNASTDRSVEIARDHAATDPRITVLDSAENRGAAWNYNRVVHESSAPYFCWNPHDDEREPTAIEHCLDAFDAHGDQAVLVHNQGVFIDKDNEIVGVDTDHFAITASSAPRRLITALQNLNVANPVLGLMRRSALERTRLIDSFAASDYVLLAELAILGTIIEVPDRGFRRRIHPESSRQAATTRDAVQAWFDPNQQRSMLSDRTRLLVEYHRSALSLGDSIGTKAATAAVIIPARSTKRARIFAGSLKARRHSADG